MGAYIEVMTVVASKTMPTCPDRAVDLVIAPLVERLADAKVNIYLNLLAVAFNRIVK